MKEQTALIVLTFTFAALTFHGMTVWHENEHKTIYENHGCTDVNITYEYFDLDKTLAVTEAYCSGEHGEAAHNSVHRTQEKLWFVWGGATLLFELFVIQSLSLRRAKNLELC